MNIRKAFHVAALTAGLSSLAGGGFLTTWSQVNRPASLPASVQMHQQQDTERCVGRVEGGMIRPFTTDAGCTATETVALAVSFRDAQQENKSLTQLFAGTALIFTGCGMMSLGAALRKREPEIQPGRG
jgi:hypothetical protein